MVPGRYDEDAILSVLEARENSYEGLQEADFIGKFAGKPIKKNLEFKFRVTNTSTAADKVIALVVGNMDTMAVTLAGTPTAAVLTYNSKTALTNVGITVDGVLYDGYADPTDTTITCVALRTNRKIRNFLKFIQSNPVLLTSIIMEATDKAQWSQELTIKKISPFRDLGDDDIISLSDYYAPNQFQDKKIEIPLMEKGRELQLDDQTVLMLGLGHLAAASMVVDITFKIGLIDNKSSDFNKAVKKAVR